MPQTGNSILGISFDGLATSGIVNEMLSVAATLRGEDLRVLVDVGGDIRMHSVDLDTAYFPPWAECTRSLGDCPKDYSAGLVDEIRTRVIAGTRVAEMKSFQGLCEELVECLIATFKREAVRFLIIENGTLPDNPLFTEALYWAIAEYGKQQKLGKYVLWRDHDLMWSAEPHLFGSYPYSGVRKPKVTEHIHYAVLTEWMRKRMQAWIPGFDCHVLPNCFYPVSQEPASRSIRQTYCIPEDAYLVARCTRVVPQKSIERDLLTLDRLQQRLIHINSRRVFLFITGPTNEDPSELSRLRAIEETLSIRGQVVWANGLLPFSPLINTAGASNDRFSIRELLAAADLNSFLTTYDYEGFGNPPGEAMAMKVPFISTTYELYHEVYGSKGAVAPLLPIDRNTKVDSPIPDDFLDAVIRLLTVNEYRQQVTRRNLEVCKRHYSLESLRRQLREMYPGHNITLMED